MAIKFNPIIYNLPPINWVKLLKENLKQFFGPSWLSAIMQIFLGYAFFYIATETQKANWQVIDYYAYGWPYHYSELWGPCFPGNVCYQQNNLIWILDIVLCYLILSVAFYLLRGLIKTIKLLVWQKRAHHTRKP